jgi:predicted phage terminase large subunit-like protein
VSTFDRKRIDALLKYDLTAFVRRVLETVAPEVVYQHNWHIEAMTWHLQQCASGETKRLIITVPPRYLKSICASVAFPAWLLGHNPAARIICISYSADSASSHARDCRRVMKSEWYKRIFPGTRLSREKNAEMEFMTTRRGYRLATSFGGPLTGRGGNYIIIDDPLKADEAMSEANRTAVNESFDRTVYSRLDDKRNDCIIVVQQRLHVDDLPGHLLAKGSWTHLNLPAIAEVDQEIPIGPNKVHKRKVGDVLHPERESRETLEATKVELGSYDYYAQYQQSPVPPEGGIVQTNWFPRYDEPPPRRSGDRIYQSWDTASTDGKTSDYSVGITFLKQDSNYFILDIVREKLNYPDLRRLIHQYWRKWRAEPPIIEDKGSGTSLIQDLRGDDFPDFPKPIAFKPEGDKITRMHAQSAKIEARHVHLPKRAPWLEEFLIEVAQFPRGRYDDQVDALSQFLCWIERRSRCNVQVMTIDEFFLRAKKAPPWS